MFHNMHQYVAGVVLLFCMLRPTNGSGLQPPLGTLQPGGSFYVYLQQCGGRQPVLRVVGCGFVDASKFQSQYMPR